MSQQPSHKAWTVDHWFIFYTDTGPAQSHLILAPTPSALSDVEQAQEPEGVMESCGSCQACV